MATPLVTSLAAWLLGPVARRLVGIEGRLAVDNLIRTPRRTGLVIGVLAASVALLMQTGGVIKSNENVLGTWLDHTVVPDLIITSGEALTVSGQNQPMTNETGQRILEAVDKPGSRVMSACLRNVLWRKDGKQSTILVIGLDARTYYEANTERQSPIPNLDLFKQLSQSPHGALVSENFLAIHHVTIGQTITLPGIHGPVDLLILGSFEDYSWNRGTVFVNQSDHYDTLDTRLADLFHLYLPPGTGADEVLLVREKLQKSSLGAEYALFALTKKELRDHILNMVGELYGLAYRQLAVVGVVATLGVLAALLISVFQRTRELGLLRAVGADKLCIVRLVLAEAFLMGLIGIAIGTLAGLPLQWFVLHVLLFEEGGFEFPISIPWLAGGIIAILAMLGVIMAGLGPAIHAMRIRIAEAIAYE